MAKDNLNSKNLEKDDDITKEKKKLKKIFKNINKNKMNVVNKLIESAAFMAVELGKLEDHISVYGVTEEYFNGKNQSGIKTSSEVTVYNTMIKNYSSIIKQLCDLSPEATSMPATGNDVMTFAFRTGKK